MIKTVASMELAVDEHLHIQKNRITPEVMTGNEKRIAIVTGTHGDELEGQFVCYELLRILNANPDKVKGIIDIYPALNPLGIDSITRNIPMFELDMNRSFPGSENGTMIEMLIKRIVDDLSDADMCIDIHASNIFLMEMPQVRISEESSTRLLPYAKMLNADFVWVHGSPTVLESTLAYSLNNIGVPTLVAEMGVGMRITESYGYQLTNGILNLMKNIGIWEGDTASVKEPIVSSDRAIGLINAEKSGIFKPEIGIGDNVKAGDIIGKILNPLTGNDEELIHANMDGMVFTRREYPVVYNGSLLARILGGEK